MLTHLLGFPARQKSNILHVSPLFDVENAIYYKTIQSAIDYAFTQSDDYSILVYPATYDEKLILKSNSNLYFMPGCTITNSATTSGPAIITANDIDIKIYGRPNILGVTGAGAVPALLLTDCRVYAELGDVTGFIRLNEFDSDINKVIQLDLISCDELVASGTNYSDSFIKAIKIGYFNLSANWTGINDFFIECQIMGPMLLNFTGNLTVNNGKLIGYSTGTIASIKNTGAGTLILNNIYIEDYRTTGDGAIRFENGILVMNHCRIYSDKVKGIEFSNGIYLNNVLIHTDTNIACIDVTGFMTQNAWCRLVGARYAKGANVNVIGDTISLNTGYQVKG